MSIFSWNCQGAGSSSFLRTLKTFLQVHKPIIVILLEPRISGEKADKVMKKIGYTHSHRVEATGFSGGIWIFWNNGWSVDILGNNSQWIHRGIFHNCLMEATAIYASPHSQKRNSIWNELEQLMTFINNRWLLIGDFNAIRSREERFGGSQRRSGIDKKFSQWFLQSNLVDMGYRGARFTWKRGMLLERLDRALCNEAWNLRFPDYAVIHLARISSDHRPILDNITDGFTRDNSRSPFRFQAAWLTHVDFNPFAASVLKNSTSFSDNIANFSQCLSIWKTNVFGNVFK
ncbi:uncharacterized protein LOC105643331 [Jatropha curcas]|uniref:uncharacterized protein LOC105643331 n=1 Tax=Jatropha curcas TaxID=180498 RepID=UPI0005FBAA42|nr:uncharacterized protein LOC105643331 [Jatropha curcas]